MNTKPKIELTEDFSGSGLSSLTGSEIGSSDIGSSEIGFSWGAESRSASFMGSSTGSVAISSCCVGKGCCTGAGVGCLAGDCVEGGII